MAKLGDKIPVQAWLSYRCKDDLAKTRRDELKTVCGAEEIRLVYDESDAKEGTHLIRFMEDLTSARCVFIFLAPNYFESSYTLFELVCIHERDDLSQRFVLPMRLSDDMVTYVWTRAKQYWDSNEAIRNELQRLLKTYQIAEDASHEAIWQRIDAAWHGVVFPYLDELHKSLEAGVPEPLLVDRVKALELEVKKVVQEVADNLKNRTIREITHLLDDEYLPKALFLRELSRRGGSHGSRDIAISLVEGEVGDSIGLLTRVMEKHQIRAFAKQEEWISSLDDAKQLCGWLLINTVSPVWWFQHELRWKQTVKQGESMLLSLDNAAYAEVIVSRSVVQPAVYELDQSSQQVKTPYQIEDESLIFDAISEGAPEQQIFIELYKIVLKHDPPAGLSSDKMLENIYQRAHSHFKRDKNKPVYYLISYPLFSVLKDIPAFQKAEQKLAGYLQFICCEQNPKGYEYSPCQEDQHLLLDQVALLLSMQPE